MPMQIVKGKIYDFIKKTRVDAVALPVDKDPNILFDSFYEMTGSVTCLISQSKELVRRRRECGFIPLGESREIEGLGGVKYFILASVPKWEDGFGGEKELMAACYRNAVKCALNLRLQSIALPMLNYEGREFPDSLGYETALRSINESRRYIGGLRFNHFDIYFVTEKKSYKEMEEERRIANIRKILSDAVIDSLGGDISIDDIGGRIDPADIIISAKLKGSGDEQPFTKERFREYLCSCAIKDSVLSERTGYSKSTISRIKSGDTANPGRKTVIALAVAMELDARQRRDFIGCAGYTYPSEEMDYCIEELIAKGFSDIDSLNGELYDINTDWVLFSDRDYKNSEK